MIQAGSLDPVFRALAPDSGTFGGPRRPGSAGPRRTRLPALRAGGVGHFVKMVHNGIEYGDHGCLCRGLRPPPPRQHRRAEPGPTPRPRRSAVPSTTDAALPDRHLHSVAARQRRVVVAARSHCERPGGDPDATNCGPRVQFGRRAAQPSRRHRRGRARAGPEQRLYASDSPRTANRISPTGCCRLCASGSAGTASCRRGEATAMQDQLRSAAHHNEEGRPAEGDIAHAWTIEQRGGSARNW